MSLGTALVLGFAGSMLLILSDGLATASQRVVARWVGLGAVYFAIVLRK